MDTTAMQKRTPIVLLSLGVVAGAVAGWLAHGALVAPSDELSASAAPPADSAPMPLVQPTKTESNTSTHGPLAQPPKTESRAAAPPSRSETPLFATDGTSPVAKDASLARASTRDESEQPSSAAVRPKPTLDDLRDSMSIQCTFGPGNGGRWPNGKLTVADAAWQGGPVDFQSINYDAGTAQMVGQVTQSPNGDVPATVTTSDSDVTFTGRTANGTLTVVSVFGRFDNAGHHTAVLSMHDGKHETNLAQFYGNCDSALRGPKSATQG
jgi:hypothetical protein